MNGRTIAGNTEECVLILRLCTEKKENVQVGPTGDTD